MKNKIEAKHSPLPWFTRVEYGTLRVRDAQEELINIQGEDDLKKFIVISANSHEALVLELAEILDGLDRAQRDGFDGFHIKAGSKAHLRIRAAIAKATGGK